MTAGSRTWLVECYLPGIRIEGVSLEAGRIRAAAEIEQAEGQPVNYLGALIVEGDEVVFHAFKADVEEPVASVAQRAGLRYARIVESVGVAPPGLADALTGLLEGAPQSLPTRQGAVGERG